MLKRILLILLLSAVALIIFFTQESTQKKQNINLKQNQTQLEKKLILNYSKHSNIEQKDKIYLAQNTIIDSDVDKYKEPPDIKSIADKKSRDRISIEGSLTFRKDKNSLDNATVKQKKSSKGK